MGAVTGRWLIVNADDFGASPGINLGIARAHDYGIVTSASLMVTMPAAEAAVELAVARPTLSIGLHVDLTGEGTPAPADIDDVGSCRRVIDTQIDRFRSLVGSGPTHLDAHHNVYRLGHLEQLFVDAAGRLGVPLREHGHVRYFPDFYGQWDDGDSHPEWINADNLIRMIEREVGVGITELSCHPGYVDQSLDSSYHREREIELGSLCDHSVRRFIESRGISLVNYHDVARLASGTQW